MIREKQEGLFEKSRFIVLFVIIYLSHSSMGSIFYLGGSPARILIFCVQVIFAIYVLLNNKYKLNIKHISILLILIINIIVTMLMNQDFTNGYFALMMSLSGGFLFHIIYSKQHFYNDYIRIMVILSIYSIFSTYLLVPFRSQLSISFPSYVNENGILYLNTFLATPIVNYGFNRNTGIYLEPGMFQVFLSFALMFELFLVNRKIKIKNVISIVIASILTFSPVALIQNTMFLLIYLINKKKLVFNKDTKKIFVSVFLLIFIIGILFNINSELKDSLEVTFRRLIHRESSYQGRTASILSNIKSGLDSPIYGKGIVNGFESTREVYLGSVTKHNTSTSTVFFMLFGFIFGFIIAILQYFSLRNPRRLLVSVLVFITSLIAVNGQLLIYDQIYYMIIFSALMISDPLPRKMTRKKGENSK